MAQSSRRARAKSRIDARSERLIRTLVAGCRNPAAALELCYWSREPGMIEIMRGIMAMPEGARAALEAFIALARDPKSIEATMHPQGSLTLSSLETSSTIALATYVAENCDDDAQPILN